MSVQLGGFLDDATGYVAPHEDMTALGERWMDAIPLPSPERGLADAALFWAAHVGGVFPLMPGTKQTHMHIGAGDASQRASRDLNVVAQWWADDRMANIGFTPQANDMLIVDIDPRSDGWHHVNDIAAKNGIDLSRIPRSESPRGDGGAHLWFRLPPGATYTHGPLARGVDRPWHVPVPPSIREVDVDPGSKDPGQRTAWRPYVWTAGDPRALPLAPECLLGEGQPVATSNGASIAGAAASVGSVGASANGRIGVGTVDALTEGGVPVGQQSYTYKRMACSMVRRKFSDAQIVEKLLETDAVSPTGDETNPWTPGDFEFMVAHARRYIESETRKEAAQNAQYGALVNSMFFGGAT